MTLSITGVNPLVQAVETGPKTKQADAPAPKSARVQPKGDTVELSKTAQIRLLKHQGETVEQIAARLGLDVKTVNSYLGAPAAPKQAASTSPKAKQAAPTALHDKPGTSTPAEDKQVASHRFGAAAKKTETSAAKAAETKQGGKDSHPGINTSKHLLV
jgi:hypothetical protein